MSSNEMYRQMLQKAVSNQGSALMGGCCGSALMGGAVTQKEMDAYLDKNPDHINSRGYITKDILDENREIINAEKMARNKEGFLHKIRNPIIATAEQLKSAGINIKSLPKDAAGRRLPVDIKGNILTNTPAYIVVRKYGSEYEKWYDENVASRVKSRNASSAMNKELIASVLKQRLLSWNAEMNAAYAIKYPNKPPRKDAKHLPKIEQCVIKCQERMKTNQLKSQISRTYKAKEGKNAKVPLEVTLGAYNQGARDAYVRSVGTGGVRGKRGKRTPQQKAEAQASRDRNTLRRLGYPLRRDEGKQDQ